MCPSYSQKGSHLSQETLLSVPLNLLQFFRKTHLYVGVFTAPAILFFAFTGILQTFSFHESGRDSSYKPPQWVVVLAQIHKKQSMQLPQKRAPLPPTGAQKKTEPAPPTGPPPLVPSQQHNPLPLRVFFLVVGLSLFASTASGIYMAWKYRRDRIVMAILLLAGIIAPVVLMRF